LLQELGDGYGEALHEHRRRLRAAFAEHGGVEVDTQGDAFFVAFARASNAVAAAADCQRALAGGPIRVRMGLHTGEPRLTEEGYVGLDVHKGARIAAVGHGGQVLRAPGDLSGAAQRPERVGVRRRGPRSRGERKRGRLSSAPVRRTGQAGRMGLHARRRRILPGAPHLPPRRRHAARHRARRLVGVRALLCRDRRRDRGQHRLPRDVDARRAGTTPQPASGNRPVLSPAYREQRSALSRLSVFRGSFDRSAAVAVTGADLRLVSQLVAKSLLRRPDFGRFELHELLRQYAAEQLHLSPAEEADARERRGHTTRGQLPFRTTLHVVEDRPRRPPGARRRKSSLVTTRTQPSRCIRNVTSSASSARTSRAWRPMTTPSSAS
jgi:hypothetical protein